MDSKQTKDQAAANRTNQCNPTHQKSGPGHAANYQGDRQQPTMDKMFFPLFFPTFQIIEIKLEILLSVHFFFLLDKYFLLAALFSG
jgi:hypothetical protein